MDAAYPKGAEALHMDAHVTLACQVDAEGRLSACDVVKEYPAGAGFAAAALSLTPDMRVAPAPGSSSLAGQSILISLRFPAPEDARLQSPARFPAASAVDTARRIVLYYPEYAFRRGVQGEAKLECGHDAHMRPTNCKVISEDPPGWEFQFAALKLSSVTPSNANVTVEPRADGEVLDYLFCTDPPSITPDTLLPRQVIEPAGLDRAPADADKARVYPPAALAAHLSAHVEMRCVVGADGVLNDCIVSLEDPEGQGFAAAALALAPSFHAHPMTVDGQPQPYAHVYPTIDFGPKPPVYIPRPAPRPDIATRCHEANPLQR
jgi:hypothetical protein